MSMIGSSVGRYEVKSQIAEGGMSFIYRAYDPMLRREVALKVIKKWLVYQSKDFQKMFEEEVASMAGLEHPNILPVYDYGYFQENPFCVFRLIEGGTLDSVLRKRKFSVKEVVRLIERLASAIDFFHGHGVVHRDLKPANILLGEQDHPYITDFGLAFIPSSLETVTTGSPFYMAPEQWQNQKTDHRADLFSFGIIIFQCFTGHYPIPKGFDISSAPHIKEYRINHINKQLPSIRDLAPNLPIGIEIVLDRLTRYDPDERFASATEAAEALVHALFSGQYAIDGKVFISYSRKNADYVQALAKELLNIGIDIWIDNNIEPGSLWDQRIEQALEECDKMLVVLSPDAVKSENVRDEWSYFLEKDKEVYPLLYKDCEIPFRLRRRQYIVATGDTFIDTSKVIDILAGGTPTRLTIDSEDHYDDRSKDLSPQDIPQSKMISEVQFLTMETGAAFGGIQKTIQFLRQQKESGIEYVDALDRYGQPVGIRHIDDCIRELEELEQERARTDSDSS